MGAITAEVLDTGEMRDGRGRRVIARAQRLALIEAFRGDEPTGSGQCMVQ